jgi:beta-galactosidase
MDGEVGKDVVLPRAGFRFSTDAAFGAIEYLGNGPRESYIDKCRSAVKDVFRTTVRENFTDYLKPQECGSHNNTDRFVLSGTGGSISVRSDTPFSFSALPYSRESLENTKHSYELKPDGGTHVCIDAAMGGVGSNSCGPALSEQYCVKGRLALAFTLGFDPLK